MSVPPYLSLFQNPFLAKSNLLSFSPFLESLFHNSLDFSSDRSSSPCICMRLYVCTKGCAVHWCRCFCCNFAGITQAACFSRHTWMVDVFLYLCCHPRYCCCYCRCLIHLFVGSSVRPSIGVAEWQESCCWPIAVGNRGYKPISCLWCNRTPVILHMLASYCSCLCPQWMVASVTNIFPV